MLLFSKKKAFLRLTDLLTPLLEPASALRGVGPALASLLTRLTGGTRVLDLLFHLPESFVDRRHRSTINEALPGQVATLEVEVVRHDKPATNRQPWRVVVRDETAVAELVFFKPARAQALAVGSRILVSGRLDRFGERLTMPHPDHIAPADRPELIPPLEPVWPLTAGLFPSQLRGALTQCLARIPELPEWHEARLLKREGWPGFGEALCALHAPREHPGPAVRARLAYDELLAHQIAISWMRSRERARPGRALVGDGLLREAALARFGHRLTGSQVRRWARSMRTWPHPRGCCGCCRAMWGPARRWWRRWRCCAPWRPGRRRR